jgi:hypothetical protein
MMADDIDNGWRCWWYQLIMILAEDNAEAGGIEDIADIAKIDDG